LASGGPTLLATSGSPGDTPSEVVVAEGGPPSAFGVAPFSYSRYRVFPDQTSMYKLSPYRAIGKLFFSIAGQGDFSCSAAVVSSSNKSVVWTAGHCVYTAGVGFHSNFSFVPGRRARSSPFGAWTAKQVFTLAGWQNGLFE